MRLSNSGKGKLKITIVEGADGAGKTTLVKHLVSSGIYVECQSPWRTDVRVDMDPYEKIPMLLNWLPLFDPKKRYVFDRFMLTDIIYDEVLDRPEKIRKPDYINLLTRLGNEHDVTCFILDREKIDKPFCDDKISTSVEQFNSIIDAYRTAAKLLRGTNILSVFCPIGSYDHLHKA